MEPPSRSAVLGLGCCLVLVAGMQGPAYGLLTDFEPVSGTYAQPNGREARLPIPSVADPTELRVVVSGTFFCDYDETTYDALYATDKTGRRTRRHALVSIVPRELRYLGPGPMRHQFVYTFAPGAAVPEAVAIAVDFDALARSFPISPSQVKSSLSGGVRLELWRPRPKPSLWPPIIATAASLGLLGWVIAIILRRRPSGPPDIGEAVVAIESAYRSALAMIEKDPRQAQTSALLGRVHEGALSLGERIAAFRTARDTTDIEQLDADIGAIHGNLAQAQDDEARRALTDTLQARYHVRDLISNAEANDERYVLRLAGVRAGIEAFVAAVEAGEDSATERAVRELEDERELLEKTLHELRYMG